MSDLFPIYDLPTAREGILRRRAWAETEYPPALLQGVEHIFGEPLTPEQAVSRVLRDIREHITNTFGGRMRRYEELVEQTLERALASLRQKAANEGYDGVVALRISHPVVTQGGVEIIVYGTGFVFSAGE